ncbi:MAG: aldehyde ferredoxin oxidoreductase family protein [Candidatus Hadarchaeota archaeon]|nr:aldehyde ferredoxin oxidoreductase family protein [Candidatus Hadarchaeota archaeon]
MLLRVNLSTGKISEEEIDLEVLENFVGGRGLGVKILSDEVDPKIDPLSPENKLVFAVGPLTGTAAPTAGRYEVVFKSPLTGTISDSNSGGYLGPEIRKLGYLAIIIEGKSRDPLYLWATDGKAELRDASKLWGKDTEETTRSLLKETHEWAKIACIGPAGERSVRMACIINDEHRAAGRGGLGAVMGSKNLKAIALLGNKKPEIAERERFIKIVKRCLMTLDKNPVTKDSLRIFGTNVLVDIINEAGIFPTRNFQEGYFREADGINGSKYLERIFVKGYNCFGCPIGCGRITRANGEEGGGPEYETVWAFGAQCGNSNLEEIAKANYLCNRLGLDTISTGNVIGCAMELSEKGYLQEEIRFGDSKKIPELVRKIGLREGIGNELAEGSKRFAEKHRHPELAMQVKGLELPAYDPRGVQGHALAYATNNRGGCHIRAYMIGPEVLGVPTMIDRFKPEGKAPVVKLLQDVGAAVDCLIMCRLAQLAQTIEEYSELLSAALGKECAPKDFKRLGERIWNLERLFNVRAGFSRKDDTLPSRFLKEPLAEGNSRGRVVKLDQMLDEYYRVRGWNSKGIPSQEKLKELGLA